MHLLSQARASAVSFPKVLVDNPHGAHHQVFRLGIGAVGVLFQSAARYVVRPLFDLNILCPHRPAFNCERDEDKDQCN